jgi:hypothetical protein
MAPRRIAAGTRARRALLIDSAIALGVALLVIGLTAGLGVVAVIAVPVLLVGLAWVGLERLAGRVRRGR